MLILVVYFLFSLRGNRRAQWQKREEAQGRISRAGEPLGTLLGAGEAQGRISRATKPLAHYWERGSGGAHFPSDKAARHTTWSGEAQGRSFPDGEPSGTVAAEKREGAVWKQRGRTSEGGACGDLPLSSLEGDVGLARPVGVDGYTGDGSATGTGVTEEGT